MTLKAMIRNRLLRGKGETRSPEETLARLPEPFRPVLLGMYAGDQQPGSDGKLYALDALTRIDPDKGMCLYDLCRSLKPQKTVEIGLGYGYSTLYILAALRENGMGSHTAIDPYQFVWNEIGFNQPDKVAMGHAFRFICEKSFPAMADLARKGERFELIFIDGSHRFDDVLVDFTLSAEASPVGGYILLDDLWMPSIQCAVSFIRKNRKDFEEIPTASSDLAAFKRIGEDAREWKFHADF
jgi:predicted O-methyltransferase YrrM